ncbi:MAG: DUF6491 family protein [Rhizomicrobium sp.]
MRAHMIALGLILASSQAAISAPAGICVSQDGIKDWAVLNDTRLIVVDRTDKKFRLSLSGACRGLQVRTTLVFRPVSQNDCLARNDAVVASLPGYPESTERCLIAEIDEYTAAMENADQIAEGTLYHHPDTHGDIGAIP